MTLERQGLAPTLERGSQRCVGAGLPALWLARAFLRFERPAWLPSSPAPASRRLPVMANHHKCGWRPEAGSNLLIGNKFIRARPEARTVSMDAHSESHRWCPLLDEGVAKARRRERCLPGGRCR